MSLKIAFKNQSAINQDADPVFKKWSMELLAETREKQRKLAEKKYGVTLTKLSNTNRS